MHPARKVLNKIENIMAGLAGALLFFMAVSVSYSVIMRYFFNAPVPWIMEISTYLLLYTTFLGAPWLLRENGHVCVDLVLNILNKKMQSWLIMLTSILGAFVSIVLFIFGTEITIEHFQRQILIVNILSTPKYLLLGIIPVGAIFLLVEFIQKILNSIYELKQS